MLRGDALHLAVEAGKDIDIPAEAWLPIDAARQVREAVLAELDHDGQRSPDARSLVEELLPDSAPTALDSPLGAIDALDGTVASSSEGSATTLHELVLSLAQPVDAAGKPVEVRLFHNRNERYHIGRFALDTLANERTGCPFRARCEQRAPILTETRSEAVFHPRYHLKPDAVCLDDDLLLQWKQTGCIR